MKKVLYVSATAFMILVLVMIMLAAIGTSEAHAITVYWYDDGKIEFTGSYPAEFYVKLETDLDSDQYYVDEGDGSVFKACYSNTFDKIHEGSRTDKRWYVYPVGPGTDTITLTNKDDSTDKWTGTVTVASDFFQKSLEKSYAFGPGHFYYDAHDTPGDFETDCEAWYGASKVIVSAPFGSRVKFYVKDSLKATKYAPITGRVDFQQNFLINMKTPVKVVINWAGAYKVYKIKIVSKSKIFTFRIKKNSRRAKVTLRKIHKGDYLKIKVGKKVAKTIKFKKAISEKIIKWTNKQKMKKGKRVTYILYNKYKQKLARATRKVG